MNRSKLFLTLTLLPALFIQPTYLAALAYSGLPGEASCEARADRPQESGQHGYSWLRPAAVVFGIGATAFGLGLVTAQ